MGVSPINCLMARIQIDTVNKIKSFDNFCMMGPNHLIDPSGEKNMVRHLQQQKISTSIYPAKVLQNCLENEIAPRCIFLPDPMIYRRMIKAFLSRGDTESDKSFLLRFGLTENIQQIN